MLTRPAQLRMRARRSESKLYPSTDGLTVEQKRELFKRLLRQELERPRYPLSIGQRALWFLHRLAPESASYNVAISARVEPPLDPDVFDRAFRAVVARHEPLRSVVVAHPDEPLQELAAIQPDVKVCDARALSSRELDNVVQADYRVPFELEARPPVRATIYRRNGHDVLVISVHHIDFDAQSTLLLIEELRTSYEGTTLPPLSAAYRDFVSWQREMLASRRGEKLATYWSERLAGNLPVLHLLCARTRPARPSHTGGLVPISIDTQLLDELRALARRHRATLFAVVLLAWSRLLVRESGQSEVIVGTPVSGRTRPEWASLIGFFVNTLPLRVRVDPRESLTVQLSMVVDTVQSALEHQDFPFSLIVDRLKVQRDAVRSPLYQTMLNVVRVPRGGGVGDLYKLDPEACVPFGNSQMKYFPLAQQLGQFDWVLELADFDDTLQGNLKYSDDAGTVADARRLARLFVALLAEMVPKHGEREEIMV
jgi:hypothetical protein